MSEERAIVFTPGDIVRVEFPLIRGVTVVAVECIIARVDDDELQTVIRFEVKPITQDCARCVFNKKDRSWKFFISKNPEKADTELPVSKVECVDEPHLKNGPIDKNIHTIPI